MYEINQATVLVLVAVAVVVAAVVVVQWWWSNGGVFFSSGKWKSMSRQWEEAASIRMLQVSRVLHTP